MSKVDNVWDKLSKEMGGSLFRATDKARLDIESVPTPSPSLNDAIGDNFGGIPIGRISQLYGPEGCGKSFFAMLMVKEFQEKYPTSECVWIDSEYSFDSKWAAKIGIDLDLSLIHI